MDAVRRAMKHRWLGALLVAGTLAGCTIKPPQVPSTNFTISIPVANDRTTIQEVAAERSDFLKIGDDELLVLDFASDFNRREVVGNRLKVTPTSNTFTTPIGTINIPGQDLPDITVGMNAILGQDVEAGATVPLIPASSFSVDEVLPALVGVRSLAISEGEIQIDMTNNLPLNLSGLRMVLSDQGDSSLDIPAGVIDELDLGTLATGASTSGSFSLAGRQISAVLGIAVTGTTEEGQNVVIDADAALTIGAAMGDLTVEEAFAVIPPQEFADSQVLSFPDDRIQVTRAVISEGGLTFRVTNEIEIIMEIELSLDDLNKADGTKNTFLITGLRPGEESEISFDLDGNQFAPENPLELGISYVVRTSDSGDPIRIFSSGEVKIEAITEDLVFSRVEGVLNGISLPLDSVTRSVDFPEGLDYVVSLDTTEAVREGVREIIITLFEALALVILGAMVLGVMIPLGWIFTRDRPEDHGLLPDGAGVREGGQEADGPLETNWSLAQVLRCRAFWVTSRHVVDEHAQHRPVLPHLQRLRRRWPVVDGGRLRLRPHRHHRRRRSARRRAAGGRLAGRREIHADHSLTNPRRAG